MRSFLLAVLVAFAAATSSGVALAEDVPGPTYEAVGGALRVVSATGTRDVPLGCEARGVARVGPKLYVACGAAGVVRLDLADPAAPVVDGRTAVDGEATAIFVVAGKAWVQIARTEARPAEGLAWNQLAQGPASTQAPPQVTIVRQQVVAPRDAPSLSAPERRGGIWEAAIGTRIFLPIGDLGVGTLGDIGVVRRFESPVALYGELSPLGIAFGRTGTQTTVAANAIVAFDTHMFELGMGFGGATVDSNRERGESFTLPQLARIGARDGIAMFVRTNIVIVDEKFELGSLTGTFQVPVTQRWRLILRGGGGPIGFAFGDAGARYQMTGDGGPGSLAVTGAVGGAAIFGRSFCQTASFGSFCSSHTSSGPSLALAFEWRL